IPYALFDKKFYSSDAEKILGFTPRQYVFKETSRDGNFGSAYGFMEISESGEKEVKSLIVNELIQQTFIFTLIMVALTFGVLLLYYYTKKGVQWTKKYSN